MKNKNTYKIKDHLGSILKMSRLYRRSIIYYSHARHFYHFNFAAIDPPHLEISSLFLWDNTLEGYKFWMDTSLALTNDIGNLKKKFAYTYILKIGYYGGNGNFITIENNGKYIKSLLLKSKLIRYKRFFVNIKYK